MRTLIHTGKKLRWEASLEWNLSDAWVGGFFRTEDVFDVSTPGIGRRYRAYHAWICLVPLFPIHVTVFTLIEQRPLQDLGNDVARRVLRDGK